MIMTLDELRERAEEFGCEIVLENPCGGDDVDDPGPFWIITEDGYLCWPGLSSLDMVAEALDYMAEERNRPTPPRGMTDEERALIAQKIAAPITTFTEGSGRKIPRLAGQLDLFRDA